MNKVIKTLTVGFIVLLARLLPFTPFMGKTHAMFSWSSLIAPALHNHFGCLWLTGLIICNKLWLSGSLVLLLRRIPIASMCASRVFVRREKFYSIGLPFLCLFLFIAHPIGNQAWMYSLYWLIPPALWLYKDTLFVRALQASFVAHGVGSVVWLYTGLLSAQVWLDLIPVVLVERILIAVGMIVCDYIVGYCMRWVSQFWSLCTTYLHERVI